MSDWSLAHCGWCWGVRSIFRLVSHRNHVKVVQFGCGTLLNNELVFSYLNRNRHVVSHSQYKDRFSNLRNDLVFASCVFAEAFGRFAEFHNIGRWRLRRN